MKKRREQFLKIISDSFPRNNHNFNYSKYIQYRSELWDHLLFDNCLNYPNLNYVSEKMCSFN